MMYSSVIIGILFVKPYRNQPINEQGEEGRVVTCNRGQVSSQVRSEGDREKQELTGSGAGSFESYPPQ